MKFAFCDAAIKMAELEKNESGRAYDVIASTTTKCLSRESLMMT